MAEHGMHQIGAAASRAGLSLRTVRYYEEVELVVPSGRTDGGFRLYTDKDIDRLILVRQLKPLDLTLDEMRQLLSARDRLAEDLDADERRRAADQLAAYADVARQRWEDLRSRLESVQSIVENLERDAAEGRSDMLDTSNNR